MGRNKRKQRPAAQQQPPAPTTINSRLGPSAGSVAKPGSAARGSKSINDRLGSQGKPTINDRLGRGKGKGAKVRPQPAKATTKHSTTRAAVAAAASNKKQQAATAINTAKAGVGKRTRRAPAVAAKARPVAIPPAEENFIITITNDTLVPSPPEPANQAVMFAASHGSLLPQRLSRVSYTSRTGPPPLHVMPQYPVMEPRIPSTGSLSSRFSQIHQTSLMVPTAPVLRN